MPIGVFHNRLLLCNKSVITCFLFWLRAGTTAFQKVAAKILLFYQFSKHITAFLLKNRILLQYCHTKTAAKSCLAPPVCVQPLPHLLLRLRVRWPVWICDALQNTVFFLQVGSMQYNTSG